MKKLKFDGFDWDSGNINKNKAKHGITCEEIEAFFQTPLFLAPDIKHSGTEQRFIAFGVNIYGRAMVGAFVFKELEGSRLIRPISVRFMHKNEVKQYEEKIAKINNR